MRTPFQSRDEFRRRVISHARTALLLLSVLASRAVFAIGPQTNPTPAPAPSEPAYLQQQRDAERDAQQEVTAMTPAATMTRKAIARFFLEKGRLAVEIGGFEAPQLTRVNVSDEDGLWLVVERQQRVRRAVRPRPMLLLNRYDFDQHDPDAIWGTYANINTHAIQISGESLQMRIVFNENANATTLTVNDNDPAAPFASAHQTFEASSLAELRNEHPAEYRKFLLPLLRKLTDTSWMLPGTTDMYEVFNDIPADDASLGELKSLLPHLDSAIPAERAGAGARLEAMGARGVLAAMRTNLSALTPEQQTVLSGVIARGRRAKVEDAGAATRDPDFLLDCLEMNAPGVKPAALRALVKVVGKPLAFDPNLSGPAADAAVDALRKKLLGGSPTTQPAK